MLRTALLFLTSSLSCPVNWALFSVHEQASYSGGMMTRFEELRTNFQFVLHEEGALAAIRRLNYHATQTVNKISHRNNQREDSDDFVDVLFINGCDHSVPHPIRYRVSHQAEQLEAVGVSTRIIDAWELEERHVRIARTFIIFRCPYFDFLGRFVEAAHALNKRVLFDIDDLVIDTLYTDQIPYLDTLAAEERALYDDGVKRMGQTMALCDGAITTTNQLAQELRNYLDIVYVNRNVASEEMLRLSERAVNERDVLPFKEKEEVGHSERHRWRKAKERKESRSGFSIGYFSGSITHNDDFEMVLPAVARFMDAYADVKLHIVGELDLPEVLERFSDRIVRVPFSSWRRLPQMLSFVDVNLIPLCDTLFNRAKSENKWVEAALVKVPSIASNVGALSDSIEQGITGLLCENSVDDWFDALVSLKENELLRRKIADNAYSECVFHHVTCGTGMGLATFIRSQEKPNLGIVLPSLDVSGGILVAQKHASMLSKTGVDVSLIAPDPKKCPMWVDVDGCRIPVIRCQNAVMRGRFDKLVATMWTTLAVAKGYQNVGKKYYLVQGHETDFYEPGAIERFDVCRTYGYNPDVTYLTISPWCQHWLENDYGKSVRYAPNGIDLRLFEPSQRDWSGKIRILIEGDSMSEYKNVDESFAIVDRLDKTKYEIWYLSYRGKPKDSYRVDRFLNKVPHEKVGDIYRQCHILLKTSVLESFSYPPLEMMATGGFAVVLRNEGNASYLVDGENCLLFDRGEDEKAARLIESLASDCELREKLRSGGKTTAESFDWNNLNDKIIKLYE